MPDLPKRRLGLFSIQEDAFIMQSFRSGRTVAEIASSLNRSNKSISAHLVVLINREARADAPESAMSRWTEDQLQTLWSMSCMGAPHDTIALSIGRSKFAIRKKLEQMRHGDIPGYARMAEDSGELEDDAQTVRAASIWMPAHRPAKRKCLRCAQVFHSAHAGNRICPRCSVSNNALGLPNHFSVQDL